MHLFSLRKSDVPLRNGKLSAECSETPHRSENPSLTSQKSCQDSHLHFCNTVITGLWRSICTYEIHCNAFVLFGEGSNATEEPALASCFKTRQNPLKYVRSYWTRTNSKDVATISEQINKSNKWGAQCYQFPEPMMATLCAFIPATSAILGLLSAKSRACQSLTGRSSCTDHMTSFYIASTRSMVYPYLPAPWTPSKWMSLLSLEGHVLPRRTSTKPLTEVHSLGRWKQSKAWIGPLLCMEQGQRHAYMRIVEYSPVVYCTWSLLHKVSCVSSCY